MYQIIYWALYLGLLGGREAKLRTGRTRRIAQHRAAEIRLRATLVFDYPTPLVLGEFLLAEIVGTRREAFVRPAGGFTGE